MYVCVRELASQRECIGSFRSIMLSPTDAMFSVAFDRKILIEEDGCFSGRIWVAAVILTVYNETPLRSASPWCIERKDYHRELDLGSDRNLYRERTIGEKKTSTNASYRWNRCCVDVILLALLKTAVSFNSLSCARAKRRSPRDILYNSRSGPLKCHT